MLWTGCVTKVGVKSSGVPGGAWSYVMWEKDAVESALDTLVSMPLNCYWPDSDDWWSNPCDALTGHDTRFVIGSVQKAWIDGDNLMCSGIIWKENFSDVAFMIQNAKDALGFSVELYPLESTYDETEDCEHVTKLEFTGVAIAWKDLCAFDQTYVEEIAATVKKLYNKRKDDVQMTEEQMKASLEGFLAQVDEKIAASNAKLEEKLAESNSKLEEKLTATVVPVSPVVPEANAEVEALKATQAELEAKLAEANAKIEAAKAPAPTAVQTAAPKAVTFDVDARLAEINKMDCSISERAKLRAEAIFAAMAEQK